MLRGLRAQQLGKTRVPVFLSTTRILSTSAKLLSNQSKVTADVTPAVSEKANIAYTPFKDFSDDLRQFFLMRFLQFPNLAKKFADLSVALIDRGGLIKQATEAMISPLTKTFSAGATASAAVNKAQQVLSKGGPQLALDYAKEMVFKPEERESVYHETTKLLDEISKTSLLYVPIKLTAFFSPESLEKLSRNEILSEEEEKQMAIERLRLFQVVEKASQCGKIIFVDQEYPTQKKAIFQISQRLMQHFNTHRPVVYTTIQATDLECADLVKQLVTDSSIKFPGIKLVNGAYVNWAHRNHCGDMMQSSKMASFVAYVTIAKYCLRNKISLYMGTHNIVLEKLIDKTAQLFNVPKEKYVKGQLFGFATKNPQTAYSIFGPGSDCVAYALRRVIEGAGSHTAASSPVMNDEAISAMMKRLDLGEVLSEEDIDLIAKAARFNVQDARVDIARENVRAHFKSGRSNLM